MDCQKCSNQSDKCSEWQASPARPTRTLHAGFVMQIKMEPDMLFVHFPFKKIYFKCLPCALFWKLTFQMLQSKLRDGSITNKDVAIQSFNKSYWEDWRDNCGSLHLQGHSVCCCCFFYEASLEKLHQQVLAEEVLASCHNLIFRPYSQQAMDVL